MISAAEFYQVTGLIDHQIFQVVNSFGIAYISVILECFNENDEPVNFPANYKYSIDVSNSAWDEPREGDFYSYYNTMIKKEDWIHLLDLSTGTDIQCNNQFSEGSMGTRAVPGHFKYTRFLCEPIPDKKIRITCGSR